MCMNTDRPYFPLLPIDGSPHSRLLQLLFYCSLSFFHNYLIFHPRPPVTWKLSKAQKLTLRTRGRRSKPQTSRRAVSNCFYPPRSLIFLFTTLCYDNSFLFFSVIHVLPSIWPSFTTNNSSKQQLLRDLQSQERSCSRTK